MTEPLLSFVVHDRPRGQGSIRSLGKGRPSIHGNAHLLKPWRAMVTTAAVEAAVHAALPCIDYPVTVAVDFRFRRPKHHYRSGKNAHLLRDSAPPYPVTVNIGDLDHLLRALGDALQAAGVITDDALIVHWNPWKRWGEHECAVVDIYPAPLP